MKSLILLQNQPIEYTLKLSPRARNVRLAVYCDGSLVVSAPQGVSTNVIERFIVEKSQWIIDKLAYFKGAAGKTFIRGSKREYKQYKEEARALAITRLDVFNQHYGLAINRIAIRSQNSRWGSCSKKGNLNFNYRIALLPAKLADYIIVHELCHLKEFNHSLKFWQLVCETLPDSKACRRELKNYRLIS